MIKAFIFDLDGTLVETESLRMRSHARAVVELTGGSLDEAEVAENCERYVGVPREDTIGELVERYGLNKVPRRRLAELGVSKPEQAFRLLDDRYYQAMVSDKDTVRRAQFIHTVALLRQVRRSGYKTGLATMSAPQEVRLVLEALDLYEEFDCIATCSDTPNGKPEPDIFLIVAWRLSVRPEECVVIEDSPPGVQSALAAGMWCIAVPNEFTRQRFESGDLLDQRWIVYDPRQLMRVVQEMVAEREK